MDKYEELLDKELGLSSKRELLAKIDDMSLKELRTFIKIEASKWPTMAMITVDKIMALRDKVDA